MAELVKKLLNISNHKKILRGEYIFYENQIGNEMYIVLSGRVGIYIDSLVGDPTLVTEVKSGEFFGEMAVFDEGVRSASAAALEDTICIVINSKNLDVLINNCPEITHKILISLSERIRNLNHRLYHVSNRKMAFELFEFEIPQEYGSYELREIKDSASFLDTVITTCPVCKNEISISVIKYAKLELERTDSDFRNYYKDFDQLWYSVHTCSECGYSNLDCEFMKEVSAPEEIVKQVVKTQNLYIDTNFKRKSRFDEVIISYFKALHFNRCFHTENPLMLVKLWMNMYWLFQDAADERMIQYCRRKAIGCYIGAYENRDILLLSSNIKQRCAAMIGELYFLEGDREKARFYLNEVFQYEGETLKAIVYDRIHQLRNR